MIKGIQHRLSVFGNRIFKAVSEYFTGQSSSGSRNILLREEYPDQYTLEWELNQNMADIALNDIRSILRTIFPKYIIQKYNKINNLFLLFYLTDDICLDEGISANLNRPGNHSLSTGGASSSRIFYRCIARPVRRCLTLGQALRRRMPRRLSSTGISFSLCKMSIFLPLYKPSDPFVKSGRFHSIRGPDLFKLLSSKIFHLRN